MESLDNAMDVLHSLEERESGKVKHNDAQSKELIGTVEHYYEKIKVAAIKLEGKLKVGDVIEVGTDEEAIRQKVSSMQINREGVEEAYKGDSVGIMINHPVSHGSEVYKIK